MFSLFVRVAAVYNRSNLHFFFLWAIELEIGFELSLLVLCITFAFYLLSRHTYQICILGSIALRAARNTRTNEPWKSVEVLKGASIQKPSSTFPKLQNGSFVSVQDLKHWFCRWFLQTWSFATLWGPKYRGYDVLWYSFVPRAYVACWLCQRLQILRIQLWPWRLWRCRFLLLGFPDEACWMRSLKNRTLQICTAVALSTSCLVRLWVRCAVDLLICDLMPLCCCSLVYRWLV